MNIKHERPPNYEKIVAAIPAVAAMEHVLFTYGDTIYYPAGATLPPYKIAHEEVHMKQQLEVGIEWWWDMFLADREFRFNEELEAYRVDYKVFCKHYKNKNERFRYLNSLTDDLAGPGYGNLKGHAEVMRLIRHAS